MQARVVELKERARLLDKREYDRAAEAERGGPRKGRTFEERVHATIEEIAAGRRATPPTTSATRRASPAARRATRWSRSAARTARPLATIVFEAKNKRLSKNDAWTELNACMGERDAVFAVLVVAGDDKVPSGLEELTEYQGNKIIAVLDRDEPDPLALRLVYRYVRARVHGRRRGELEVDAAGVRDAAEEAAARLKRANRVRKSLTNVTNSAKAARDEFDAMVADVERCLDADRGPGRRGGRPTEASRGRAPC